MQYSNACPGRHVSTVTSTRQRDHWRLFAKAMEPMTALHGTPDDHWQPDPSSPTGCRHVPHTPAWDAAEAEVRRRLDAYNTLQKF